MDETREAKAMWRFLVSWHPAHLREMADEIQRADHHLAGFDGVDIKGAPFVLRQLADALPAIRALDGARGGAAAQVTIHHAREDTFLRLDGSDARFYAATTDPVTGYRATVEALARAEARIAEMERAGDALAEIVANAGAGTTHSADCGGWHDNCRKLAAWTAAKGAANE